MNVIKKLKRVLPQSQINFLKKIVRSKTTAAMLNGFNKDNLRNLALIYGTDKWGTHWYMEHYETHFSRFKNEKIKLLEIGVGGYDSPTEGGSSLKVWKKYFTNAKIFAIDIYDKSKLQENRIRIFQGSQVDPEFLAQVVKETGELDIIVDDGSHYNSHVIDTFQFLFPYLKNGGIYVVEDTQTSYREDHGGDPANLTNPNTIMNFFKALADSINHKEFLDKNNTPSYLDEHIIALHFYHNMIFIYKGINDELPTLRS